MTGLYVILSILVLAFLIFFHELGHFAVGKALGFRVLGFSIGFGPKLIKFTKGETEYSLRAIPFGGACMFDGEDESAGDDDPRRFNAQPVWKRFLVILAGPVMNVLLAFLIAFIVMLSSPVPIYETDPATGDHIPYIAEVAKDSAAEKAGIQPNDIIISVDGKSPLNADDGMESTNALVELIGNAGDTIVIIVERDGEQKELTASGFYNEELGKNQLGITIGLVETGKEHLNIGEAFTSAFDYLGQIIKLTAEGIAGMFKNGIHKGDVSGVVGAVAIMADVASESILNLIYISIVLSLSLGLFNLIPFPALDGGRLLFLIIEAIIGRPLNRKVEGIINAVGLALLFGLMIIVTVFDVIGLFS